MPLPDNAETTSSTGNSATTSTSYQDKATLTFTPASTQDYIIIFHAQVKTSNASSGIAYVDFEDNGSSLRSSFDSVYVSSSNDWIPVAYTFKKSSVSGSNTFKVRYKTNSASYTCTIRHAHIVAIPVGDFKGTVQYAESQTLSSSTSSTYGDKVTLTFTPSEAEPYLIIYSAHIDQRNAADACKIKFLQGSTTLGEGSYSPKSTSTNDRTSVLHMEVVKLPASSTTFKIQWGAVTGGAGRAATIQGASIIACPLYEDDTNVSIRGGHVRGGNI